MRAVVALLIALACTSLPFVVSQTCSTPQAPSAGPPVVYPSRCFGHIQYAVQLNDTAGQYPPTCLSDMELLVSPLDQMSTIVSSTCHVALTRYLCRSYFPPCNGTALDRLPPTEVCDFVNASCTAQEISDIETKVLKGGSGTAPFNYVPYYNSAGDIFKFVCTPPTTQTNNGTDWTMGNVAITAARKPLCETYGTGVTLGAGESIEDTFCYPFLGGKSVYVSQYFINAFAQTSQQPLFDTMKTLRFMVNIFPAATCAYQLAQLICTSLLPECFDGTALGLAVYAPRLTDRSICDAVDSNCKGLSASLDPLIQGVLPQISADNCSLEIQSLADDRITPAGTSPPSSCVFAFGVRSTVANPLFPRFPDARYYLPGSNNQLNVSTSDILPESDRISKLASAADCPWPTVQSSDPVVTRGGQCATPCPTFVFDDDTYDDADIIIMSMTGIGLLLMILLSITFACFKKTRKKYNLYFTITMIIINQSLLFSFLAKHDGVRGIMPSMRCEDNAHGRLDGWCLWQAICMLFGANAAACWWFIQSLDLYLQMKWNSRKWSKETTLKKDITYFCWGWAWPFLVCLICISGNELGNPVQGGPWCFFLFSGISWGLFYGPIFAQMVIGALLMGIIIKQLYTSSVKMKTHKKKGHWRLYVKPLLFVALFLLVWLVIFAYRFHLEIIEDEVLDTGEDFIVCVLGTKPGQALLGNNIVCPPYTSPPRTLYMLLVFFIATTGILCFFLYYSRENIVMWFHFCTCRSYNYSQTSGSQTGSMSKSSTGTSTEGRKKRIIRPKKGHKRLLTKGESSKSNRDLKPALVHQSSQDIQSVPVDKELPTNVAISYPPANDDANDEPPPLPAEDIELIPTSSENVVTGGRGSVMGAPGMAED